MDIDILIGLLAFVVSVAGWLLRQKDAQQAKDIENLRTSIKLLFEKHDQDVAALQELRLQIAEGHYKKAELDARFDRMEKTFTNGFDSLGKKIDELTNALITHITKEAKNENCNSSKN